MELLDLLAATYRVRHRHFGNTVQLYFLMNAKSGLCPEDCGYCSQSKVSEAEIPRYNVLSAEKLLDGARIAYERGSKTYCIVISARGPNEREMTAVTTIVPEIKAAVRPQCLRVPRPADRRSRRSGSKACGVDKVNHNLNTSESFYGEICTTHTLPGPRRDAARTFAPPGMQLCSGGIIGMGESDADVVRDGVRAPRPGRRVDPAELSQPDRWHAAGRDRPPQPALLPEGAVHDAAGEPGRRAADRRRARDAPRQPATAGLVSPPIRSSSATISPRKASRPRPTTG